MANSDITPPPTKRRRLSQKPAIPASIPSRPIQELSPLQLRIFSWNVNGIAPFLQRSIKAYFTKESLANAPSNLPPNQTRDSGSPSLPACLRRWKFPQIVCLQEVKIARHDTRSQQAVKQAVKHSDCPSEYGGEPGYNAFFNLPNDKFNARGFRGKLYGVCTLVRNDLMQTSDQEPQIEGVEWDHEGRVLRLELKDAKLVVFNVYAVNGTENPYRDPKTGIVAGTRHDRKRVFHEKLQIAVKEYEQRGWDVVIAGDLNIARHPVDGHPGRRMGNHHVRNRQDFEQRFMSTKTNGGLEMVDTFRSLHGEEPKYSYHPRGIRWGSSCDRVDLILLSRSIAARLAEADILDEEVERDPSDHVPLYVTLSSISCSPGINTKAVDS